MEPTKVNNQPSSLNWGIIGLGKIAAIVAADLVQYTHAKLYAVASRSTEKATDFAEKFRAEKAYADYATLINDPNVEVVYIATPHAFHFELALACLKAKKHVLCEKPLCMNAKQVSQLCSEAKNNDCFLMEGIWTRFMPSTKKLIELLSEGRIGNPVSVQADFGFQTNFDKNSRLFNKNLGGGSLLDIGIYPIYMSLLCLGKPSKISAKAKFSSTGIDTTCQMNFYYDKAKEAELLSSFEEDTPTQALITGTKGSIKLHRRFHQSTCVEVFDVDGTSVDVFSLPYQGNGYIHEIEEVTLCIQRRQTESELLPHATSLQLAEIMDKVQEEIGLTY